MKWKEIKDRLVQDKFYRMTVVVRGVCVLWGGLLIKIWVEDPNPDTLFRVYLPVAFLYLGFVYVTETLIKSLKLNNSCAELIDKIISKMRDME